MGRKRKRECLAESAARLGSLAAQHDCNAEELADRLGIDAGSVRAWFDGQASPSAGWVRPICRAITGSTDIREAVNFLVFGANWRAVTA